MSFITAFHIENKRNEYSDNLLTYASTFENDLTWNITSGTGTITQDINHYFQGNKSLKIESLDNTLLSFNTITDLGFTTQQTGNYIFSFEVLFEDFLGDDPNFIVNIFKNGILLNNVQAFYSDNNVENNWGCYSQIFNFNAGDVITYNFSYQSGSSTSQIIWIDGLKFEFDDRNLRIPTAWSMSKDFCCSDTKGYLKNTHQGWGYYADSLTTPSIIIGNTYAQITIDALGAFTNTNYLPLEIRGVSELWSGNKITPISVGDDYDGRFDVTISAKSGSPSYIEVILDISGSTAGTNKVFTGYIQTGSATPYDQSLPLDFFSLATFLSNGGRLYAKVDTGSVTLTRRNIKISRKSKAF